MSTFARAGLSSSLWRLTCPRTSWNPETAQRRSHVNRYELIDGGYCTEINLGAAAPNRCCVTFAGLCAFSLRCCQYALRRESLTGAILLGSQHSMPQGI